MTIASPIIRYLTSGSPISNLSRMTQPQEGLGYIPQAMPPLTISSLLVVRQQMDDSKHDMVNMLPQQISIIFNPLIHNTIHSYSNWCIK